MFYSQLALSNCASHKQYHYCTKLGLGTSEAKFKVQYFHKYSENTWLVCLVRRLEEHSEKEENMVLNETSIILD